MRFGGNSTQYMGTSQDTGPITKQVTVHALQTGLVRVRTNQVRGKGHGIRRLLNTFLDSNWGPWLPIHAWLIEHPEGLIIVDTGETARTGEPGYLPGWHPYYRRGVEFDVAPDQEIGPQLQRRGFDPREVRWVIMTHLHTDHAGGLHHFPNSEILVPRLAWNQAKGLPGRLRGFLPHRYPAWLQPSLFDLESVAMGPFPQSYTVTEAGDVVIVPTPGHTGDHVSVVVRDEQISYFLAGDASYTEQLMVNGQVDGLPPDENVACETLQRIHEFAMQEPTVYLPSHDPQAADRLATTQLVGRQSTS